MSFSSTVKNELCRLEIRDTCCLHSELAGVIRGSGVIKYIPGNGAYIKIVTENAAFARRIFSTIKAIYGINPEISIRKSKKLKKHVLYTIIITHNSGAGRLIDDLGIKLSSIEDKTDTVYKSYSKKIKSHKCCKKAYLRGCFLAAGSVSDPEKTYHLEIANHSREMAAEINALISKFGLKPRIIRRKGYFISYLKEGGNIVDFLNIIGAHTALLSLENIRILKEMRNNVNRIVNCETANLDKTVNASCRQIDNIKYIKKTAGIGKLPPNLREIAELRLKHSDLNLKELGEMLTPPLGKSGVNHRLRKLDAVADSIRNLKGEL